MLLGLGALLGQAHLQALKTRQHPYRVELRFRLADHLQLHVQVASFAQGAGDLAHVAVDFLVIFFVEAGFKDGQSAAHASRRHAHAMNIFNILRFAHTLHFHCHRSGMPADDFCAVNRYRVGSCVHHFRSFRVDVHQRC